MDLYTQVLIEMHRVQTLLFIRKNPHLLVDPLAVDTLATHLQLPAGDCWTMIGELVEEGFIAPLPRGPRRFRTPLRLTAVGEGLLDWVRTRSTILADPRLAAANPLMTVH